MTTYKINQSKQGIEFVRNSKELLSDLEELSKHGDLEVTITRKRRTNPQNAAMHLDFSNIAKICRDNNITADMLFDLGNEAVPVNEKIVKEFWHSVLERMGLEPKTSKLKTDQVTDVRAGIERAFALEFGVDIGDFPSEESLRFKQIY